ncbi:MAG: hypothetical protein AB7S41_16735 [Parvibaculaceae bacterium]
MRAAAISLLRASLCLGAVLVVPLQPATAADEPPVVKAVYDGVALLFRVQPTSEKFDILPDGAIRLSKFSIPTSADQPAPVTAEQVTFSGIKEQLGRYDIGELKFTGMTLSFGGGASVVLPQFVIRDMVVKPVPTDQKDIEGGMAATLPAREYEIPEALLLLGNESASVEKIKWTWDGDFVAGSATAQFGIEKVAVPGSLLKQMLDIDFLQLGYGSVELGLSGRWKIAASGDARSYDIEAQATGKDMASIQGSLSASNVPPHFLLAALLGNMGSTEFAELMRKPTLNGLKIRYEDRSFLTRTINSESVRRGIDVAAFTQERVESLQREFLDFKGSPVYEKGIASYTKFLNEPRSLDIELKPPAPLPGAVILDAMQVPTVLLYVLGPSVEANR